MTDMAGISVDTFLSVNGTGSLECPWAFCERAKTPTPKYSICDMSSSSKNESGTNTSADKEILVITVTYCKHIPKEPIFSPPFWLPLKLHFHLNELIWHELRKTMSSEPIISEEPSNQVSQCDQSQLSRPWSYTKILGWSESILFKVSGFLPSGPNPD